MAQLSHLDVDDWRNRHGFPHGYYYEPNPIELLDLLVDRLVGRPLADPLPTIFHDVRIRDFTPEVLYERYKQHQEAGFIYFFSEREKGTANKRAARVTENGSWKASGSAKKVTNGGADVGLMFTLVFYKKEVQEDDDQSTGKKKKKKTYFTKTDWAMQEFVKIIGPNGETASTAIYRLYKMRSRRATTMEALPIPRPAWVNHNEASTSQAHAQTSIAHNRGEAFGVAVALQDPGPSNCAVLVSESQPVQLQDDGINWLDFLMAEVHPSANYGMMSHHQQQGIGQINLSVTGDQCMSQEMVLPLPPTTAAPPSAPLMESVSEPAALCAASSSSSPSSAPLMESVSEPAALCAASSSQQQQQQLDEQLSCPEQADRGEQLPNIDSQPSQQSPASAAEEYMVNESSMWCEEQQGWLPPYEPWVTLTEEEIEWYTQHIRSLAQNRQREGTHCQRK